MMTNRPSDAPAPPAWIWITVYALSAAVQQLTPEEAQTARRLCSLLAQAPCFCGAHTTTRLEPLAALGAAAQDDAWQQAENDLAICQAKLQAAEAKLAAGSSLALEAPDVSFAAEVIHAFLAMGVCPSGYDRDDLRQFVARLRAGRHA